MYKRCCQDHQIISRTFGSNRNELKTSKMKMMIVVSLALVAAVSALPVQDEVTVLRSGSQSNPDGSFSYGTELSDKSSSDVTGELKTVNDAENKPVSVVVVRGSYRYISPEGEPIEITYIADENGFHAEGNAIPKAVSR